MVNFFILIYFYVSLDVVENLKLNQVILKRQQVYVIFVYKKENCERKEREFGITLDQFKELIIVPKCHYCDDNLVFNKHTRDENSKPQSRASHLDRKDNNRGYTIDNVVLCCWECNRLKSNRFTYNEFIKLSPMLKEIMKNRKLSEQSNKE